MNSLQDTPARVEALSGLSRFRAGFHACFTRRGDALFELADAMLCAQGPVRSPVELSLEPEFRRRHGSVCDALAKGRISSSCLRHLLAGLSAPARAGEPLMFAIGITPHARPDAQYAGERTMVQVRGKGGDSQRTPELSGRHRPVGIPGHGCLRPATSRPPPRGRPAPPLAPTARPGQAPQSLQGPARLPPTPRTNRHTRRLAQTHAPRPRPPERLEEPPEIPATALPQGRTHHQQTRRVTTEA